MRTYRIEYYYSDGFVGEVEVEAEDRDAALEVFEGFASEDVVSADCICVDDEED